ncbi:MAG: glycerol kinase GlpK [Woeseiaceae bacterium]|nr:glycerol kinase GlpK [Woeseiaceae bacterium]
MSAYILAIDQGTSSSRTVIFDSDLSPVASAQQEFEQFYPSPGWVEHDPEEIWSSVRSVSGDAMQKAGIGAGDVAAIGITNQRETTLVWRRDTGACIHKAIVWQDRRTADLCERLRADGHEADVTRRTGLKLDPYFSATKVAWILDNVDGARELAEQGQLAFGTVDCFLLWRLTDGAVHATDISNASRTLLFNIHDECWDESLLELFSIPMSMMPAVRDCADDFGETRSDLFDAPIPISGIAGDQQAALIGQAGFAEGVTKSTYGTGCFVIANTGTEARPSHNQLLTTIASRIDGKTTYGLEGSVFVAGSAIQWLRDELQIVDNAPQTEQIAEQTGIVDDVVVVPAFAGLGAPYWDPHARGAVYGLSRGSGRNQLITATLQAVAYQTRDLVRAMAEDGVMPKVIRVDGGMVANNWFLQFLADILDIPVERPTNVESTVLGAACLAAYRSGLVKRMEDLEALWQRDRLFEPDMDDQRRQALLAGWDDAVRRTSSTT